MGKDTDSTRTAKDSSPQKTLCQQFSTGAQLLPYTHCCALGTLFTQPEYENEQYSRKLVFALGCPLTQLTQLPASLLMHREERTGQVCWWHRAKSPTPLAVQPPASAGGGQQQHRRVGPHRRVEDTDEPRLLLSAAVGLVGEDQHG